MRSLAGDPDRGRRGPPLVAGWSPSCVGSPGRRMHSAGSEPPCRARRSTRCGRPSAERPTVVGDGRGASGVLAGGATTLPARSPERCDATEALHVGDARGRTAGNPLAQREEVAGQTWPSTAHVAVAERSSRAVGGGRCVDQSPRDSPLRHSSLKDDVEGRRHVTEGRADSRAGVADWWLRGHRRKNRSGHDAQTGGCVVRSPPSQDIFLELRGWVSGRSRHQARRGPDGKSAAAAKGGR